MSQNYPSLPVIKKEGQRGNMKSDIDVANVLLQLKDKEEQEVENQINNGMISNKKKIMIEEIIKRKSLNDSYKYNPISIASLNNSDMNDNKYPSNVNPYRSPSSTVYSSPVLGQMDRIEDVKGVKEEALFRNTKTILPPVKYLLETKVMNSSMKDNILPVPDLPSFRNAVSHISEHLKIHPYKMEMNKEDLLFYKSFSSQQNDFKVSRKSSSYSSVKDNENNYNIPKSQNMSSYNSNERYMYENRINNFSHSNPSPNSDHMYASQPRQPQQPVTSLPPPSMMVDQHANNQNTNTYSQYQNQSYYSSTNNSNSHNVPSSMNYSNNNSILSEQENSNRNVNEPMNIDNVRNLMIQNNSFDSIDINKTIKLCPNGPNGSNSTSIPSGSNSNVSSKRFGPIPGKKKEKESRRFPKYIIHILETSYNTSHYPSNNEKDRLVHETKLTHRQINDWFINKRARSSCSHQNKRRNLKKIKLQQKQQSPSQS
ncbi:hypothetical protein PIROE2DRAFT_63450 [Piromyces sp. E2]|nr:hypothetical protein PIROE2DRAFT_63450 [Piromyces sp. E2]|eukprot:OUM59954.1 hypothetical protein PIROE2DRAFT_63450 [Piromyces sp. E2]